jgi:hypothetical protein
VAMIGVGVAFDGWPGSMAARRDLADQSARAGWRGVSVRRLEERVDAPRASLSQCWRFNMVSGRTGEIRTRDPQSPDECSEWVQRVSFANANVSARSSINDALPF